MGSPDFWSTCPECGDCAWNDLGCTNCGLEFFPPSETYWSASAWELSERIARLLNDWGPDVAPPLIRETFPVPQLLPLRASASPIEKAFWEAHRKLSLPELRGLVFQHRAGKFSIDFALPGDKIGFELDGFRNHSTTEDIAKDHSRQRWLLGLGWQIIRFGGSEIRKGAESCVKQAAWLADEIRQGGAA
jgi:very-short-patch-repair endonuclease